jgi:Dipeptide/tripeptide permease
MPQCSYTLMANRLRFLGCDPFRIACNRRYLAVVRFESRTEKIWHPESARLPDALLHHRLLIEMWERFGFYGMQVLMVTF